MSMLRSIAYCAVALIASAFIIMPASAAVPIDPGMHAAVSVVKEHPALAVLDLQHVAIVSEREFDASPGLRPTRSMLLSSAASVAFDASNRANIVDLRRRC